MAQATVIRVHQLKFYTVYEVVKTPPISPFLNPIFWDGGKRYLRASDGSMFFSNEVPIMRKFELN